MMDRLALGRRLKEERLRLNLTQEKLAEDVDLSTAYIGQVERGERSLTLERLVAIAKRLGVTVDFLLADFVPIEGDGVYNVWCQLMAERSEAEKALAVNMVKLMFGYIDGSLAPEVRK